MAPTKKNTAVKKAPTKKAPTKKTPMKKTAAKKVLPKRKKKKMVKVKILKSSTIPAGKDRDIFMKAGVGLDGWAKGIRARRAAKEISHYTSQPGLVLSKTAFKGIVNALTQLNGYNLDKDDPDNNDDRSLETYHMGKIHDRLYFTEDAMETLQDVVEQFLVNEFNLAAHEQINQSRLTLLPRDLHKVAVNRYEMDHSAPKRFYAIDETFPRMLTHDQAIKEGVYWDRTWYDERLTKEEMKALGFGDEEEVTKWDRQEANSDARNERSKAAAAERAREEEERKKRSEALKAQREKRAEKRGPPGSRKKLIGKIGKPTDDNGKGGKGPGGK